MIKVLESVVLAYLNIIKDISKKPTDNIIVDGEKLKAIPLNSGMRQDCPLSIPFNIGLSQQ